LSFRQRGVVVEVSGQGVSEQRSALDEAVYRLREFRVQVTQLKTRGIRVGCRVKSVDILENLISVDNRQPMLRMMLRFGAGSAGLVDIGYGTGRLAVAATHLHPR